MNERLLHGKHSVPKETIDRCGFAWLCCQAPSHIETIYEGERILFGLLSIARKRMIGYNLANIVALVNHILEHHEQYYKWIRAAIFHYNIYEELMEKTSTNKKIEHLENSKPFQDTKYDEMFKTCIPEIYPSLDIEL